MNHHITIDAADAVELIEILEYLIETTDSDGPESRAMENCQPYDIDDLRADLTRLIESLNHSPLTP